MSLVRKAATYLDHHKHVLASSQKAFLRDLSEFRRWKARKTKPKVLKRKPLSPYLGDIPKGVWDVLEVIWDAPRATQGDFARSYATYIALGASMGWITTITHDGTQFGNHWRLTISGQVALQHARDTRK